MSKKYSLNRVALVTGASSGIGRAVAIKLASKGFIVYGAARRIDKLEELKQYGIKPIYIDVTNEKAMIDCVDTIIKEQGKIDVLVNNAGFGQYGSVEDTPIDDARYQFEVNLFGVARLTQLVIPHMRDKHYGRIINVASIGGKLASPFGAWYHATKFAMEGFSDALRNEVRKFGIKVVVIEPGGIQSEWAGIAMDNLIKISGEGYYKDSAKKMADTQRRLEKKNTPVEKSGKVFLKAASRKNPKTRYRYGYGSKMIVWIHAITTDKFFDKLMSTMM